jgi:anti-sigma B factor antagonist
MAKAQGGWAVITLDGEIDLARVDELALLFTSKWESGAKWDSQCAGLIVDLTPVTFMDSSGLGWLLRIQPEIVKDGGRLRIVVGDGTVRRVFEISGLADELELYPSVNDAMSSG